MISWGFALLLTAFTAVGASPIQQQPNSTVVADLGYTLQQGTLTSSEDGPAFYRFDNVQYATAKRFGLPTAPKINRTLQTGQTGYICGAGLPLWFNTSLDYLSGQTPVWSNATLQNVGNPPTEVVEDCLYLNMLVPQQVYANKTKPVPVMLWIHGGGYTAGSRTTDGAPVANEGSGFLDRSKGNVIFISISYRLGLFGWLAGPSFQQNAPANLGLRDQRAALQWVQNHIGRFNGDPENVMVFGESAGAGSAMHQMIAFGGKRGTPFKNVILQSPWHQPIGAGKAEGVYKTVLQMANVSNFDGLKKLDFATLWKVNAVVVGNARPYSQFDFGPTVDGDILPDTYTNLINTGRFDRKLHVLVGHTSDEGAYFTSPFIRDEAAYRQWLVQMMPDANASVIDFVEKTLYPPVYDGSQGYTNIYSRLDRTVGDMSINCNAYLLNTQLNAYNGMNKSFAFFFSVPPGYHAGDLPYTFYVKGQSNPGVNATIARALQEYETNFASAGNPNGHSLPRFPAFQEYKFLRQMNLNTTGIYPIDAENVNSRCEWWSQGLYMWGSL